MEHHQMKIKHLIMIILSITLVVIPVYADDYQEGMDALGRKDIKTALKKFKPLAEKGHLKAQARLGWMYANGKGVPQDYKEAAKWYQLAGEQGLAVAQYQLGEMYGKGQEIPLDYKKAIKWLLKSAEQKNLTAQRLIRASYHKLHKEVAEQGDSYAQRFLGDSYYLGLEVTQDYAEAAKWYKKAAEQGDSVSQIILGAMYEKGKGISKDFVEAYKWFSISGETGNGRMYIEKLGKRKMTTAQIAEGQKLAEEWIEKHK